MQPGAKLVLAPGAPTDGESKVREAGCEPRAGNGPQVPTTQGRDFRASEGRPARERQLGFQLESWRQGSGSLSRCAGLGCRRHPLWSDVCGDGVGSHIAFVLSGTPRDLTSGLHTHTLGGGRPPLPRVRQQTPRGQRPVAPPGFSPLRMRAASSLIHTDAIPRRTLFPESGVALNSGPRCLDRLPLPCAKRLCLPANCCRPRGAAGRHRSLRWRPKLSGWVKLRQPLTGGVLVVGESRAEWASSVMLLPGAEAFAPGSAPPGVRTTSLFTGLRVACRPSALSRSAPVRHFLWPSTRPHRPQPCFGQTSLLRQPPRMYVCPKEGVAVLSSLRDGYAAQC